MKDKFFLILGIAIITWSFYAFFTSPPAKGESEGVIIISGESIPVEIADMNTERIQGLSGRDSLTAGFGILFVFEKSDMHGFWMKDMKFPIDIIWISDDWRVVAMEKKVSPDTFPFIFYPPVPAKYVLELNAGEAEKLGIEPGKDVLEFKQ